MTSRELAPGSAAHQGVPGWDSCWEAILCLATEDLPHDHIFDVTKQLVELCRHCMTAAAPEWFAEELADACLFVAEQRAGDPADADWLRIEAALAGARAGLA